MAVVDTPRPTRWLRTLSARLTERRSLPSSLPVLSVWPTTRTLAAVALFRPSATLSSTCARLRLTLARPVSNESSFGMTTCSWLSAVCSITTPVPLVEASRSVFRAARRAVQLLAGAAGCAAGAGAGGGADCEAQPAMNINAAAAAAPETRSFLMRFPSNGPLKKR
jgi:hypothetical protein